MMGVYGIVQLKLFHCSVSNQADHLFVGYENL